MPERPQCNASASGAGEQYKADNKLKAELARFYLAHQQKIPPVSPWICEKCWETFKPELPKLLPE